MGGMKTKSKQALDKANRPKKGNFKKFHKQSENKRECSSSDEIDEIALDYFQNSESLLNMNQNRNFFSVLNDVQMMQQEPEPEPADKEQQEELKNTESDESESNWIDCSSNSVSSTHPETFSRHIPCYTGKGGIETETETNSSDSDDLYCDDSNDHERYTSSSKYDKYACDPAFIQYALEQDQARIDTLEADAESSDCQGEDIPLTRKARRKIQQREIKKQRRAGLELPPLESLSLDSQYAPSRAAHNDAKNNYRSPKKKEFRHSHIDRNQLCQQNRNLAEFSADVSLGLQIWFPPAPAPLRKILVKLCELHKLNVRVSGSKNRKCVVAYRKRGTERVEGWEGFVDLIMGVDVDVNQVPNPPPGNNKKERSRKKELESDDIKPKAGHVVGSTAKRIGEGNMGHRMMLSMGWKPGDALGAEGGGGILDPIMATVRGKRTGLGG